MNHGAYFGVMLCCFLCIGVIQQPYYVQSAGATSSDQTEDILEMISQVDEGLVQNYVTKLCAFRPRYTGTTLCTLAAQYLFDELSSMGLETSFHEWFYKGFRSRNVVATLPGTDPESTAVFIICGHYDTVEVSPGADDDASGVASVLACARIMSQYSFPHTIRFIAFSGEEVGTLGSFSYARDAYRQEDNIVAVLNLDMVGYANSAEGGSTLRFFPAPRARWIADFAESISEKYKDIIDMNVEILPCYIGSDAQPFIDYGYDGVWIAHHDGYSWGHSADDVPEHLNYTYHAKATRFMLAVLAEFAIKPLPVQVIIKTPLEGYGYFFDRPTIKLDLGKQWYKGLRGITIAIGRPVVRVDVLSSEPIKYVVFCVDGNFMYWDSQAPFEWKLGGLHYPLVGRHTLQVYAYTTEGNSAVDEMQIIILTFSCQYS
ncbi:MAG: M28 family metallopeptidase [Candidatus Thermoplasmatota archaeon]